MKKFYSLLILLTLISPSFAFAANRFWVGGTNAWDTTAGGKWSTTSGGVGGAAVPTVNDDVFFDANSSTSSITVTINGNQVSARNLDFTGFTATFSEASAGGTGLTVGGSLTAVTGSITFTRIVFAATSTGKTVTTAGHSLSAVVVGSAFNGVGGGWTLLDNLTVTGSQCMLLTNGSVDFGGKDVTVPCFDASNANTRSLTLGTGTFTLGTAAVQGALKFQNTTGFTFTSTGSKIIFTGNVGALLSGGVTFNTVTFKPTGGGTTATSTIEGSNTFSNLTFDISGVATDIHVAIASSSTQTITGTFNATGTPSKTIRILTDVLNVGGTLSSSNGPVCSDYLSLRDITATGGTTWYAGAHSINIANNTGWTFAACPAATFKLWQFFGF